MKIFSQTTALILTVLWGAGLSSSALSQQNAKSAVKEAALILPTAFVPKVPMLKAGARIGFARLDKGRLIAAPMSELRNWAAYDIRTSVSFKPVSPAALLRNIPEVAMSGRDSDNKLDEIRMTASDMRLDYVLIYGMGKDALWGSFAGKSMMETGLIAAPGHPAPGAKTKALLVDTYSGKIYGTITSNDTKSGLPDLVSKVETLIEDLGYVSTHTL